jgi:hypothetical protein
MGGLITGDFAANPSMDGTCSFVPRKLDGRPR